MSDLNISLILRLVDKATAPARAAARTLQGQSDQWMRAGREQMRMSTEQIGLAQQRQQALLAEGAALAASGYAMVKMLQPAVQFEAQMSKVQAVARATPEELDRLTRSARQLGRETPWSARQAAEGMEFLAMAGFKTNEVVEAMPGMLNLASAGAIDLGQAADIASNILTGFGLQADEMGRVGDVMTNTFTSSNTTLSMLGQTMKYVAPIAASTGTDLETAAAMAGKLGDAGIQGSEAGTALRAVLTRLAAPSKEAAKVLGELGVATQDANGNLRPVPELLAEIDSAMKGHGSAARAEMIKTLFETEAMSAATVLLGAAGSGALQDYTTSLREAGSAARVAAAINDNTAGALKTLASRAEGLSIAIGTSLLPILVEMTETIVPVVDKITAWAEANPELVKSIGWMVLALFGVRAALFAVKFAVQPLIIAFWAFNWALGATAFGAGALGRALGLLPAKAAAAAAGVEAASTRINRAKKLGEGFGLKGLVAGALTYSAVSKVPTDLEGQQKFREENTKAIENAFRGSIPFFKEFEEKWNDLQHKVHGDDWQPTGREITDELWRGMEPGLDQIAARSRSKLVAAFNLSGIGSITDPAMRDYPYSPSFRSPGAVTPGGATAGRSTGGAVRAGQIYEWQENGLEFFTPNVDGRVIDNRAVRRMAGAARGGGGTSVTVGDIHITAAPGMDAEAVANAVIRKIEDKARSLRGALHDGGDYAV